MRLRRALPLVAGLIALAIFAIIAYGLLFYGMSALSELFGDWKQIAVGGISAAVMGVVGLRLTRGHGNLATAGQYEKIAVWAALLLSIVSAITTSLGLLLVLSPNPRTGALLMVGMAVLLGVGIQLSMLMYALRLGDGVQRLAPMVAAGEDDDEFEEEPRSRNHIPLWVLLGVFALAAVGAAMIFGRAPLEILFDTLRSLYSNARSSEAMPEIIGAILILGALVLAIRSGLLPRPGVVAGLLVSLSIYGVLLLFSSGFGYLSYFLAAQSDEVRAIDRDNRIETETAALARQIRAAATEDVREALLEARSGDDYQDLSKRIDALSSLFVVHRSKLEDQVNAYEARRQEIINRRRDVATSVDQARVDVRSAEQAVGQAKRNLARTEEARTRRMKTLRNDLGQAEKKRDDAAAGRDESGVAKCGRRCKAAQALMDRIQRDIDALDKSVLQAESAVISAQGDLAAAKRNLETITAGGDDAPVNDPPPSIVNRTSFTSPRNEYAVTPSKQGLKRIAQTCTAAKDMLITLKLPLSEIPACDVSKVEAWLTRHEEGQQALKQMEMPCRRTEQEVSQEAKALAENGTPDIKTIPPHLRGRLAWISRCLTAANTGTPRMVAVARDVNRLESEYTTAGYDVRRVLRSLNDGNLYALFAVLMALVVDTAILFSGFAANAYRSRDLGEDHRLVAPVRIADRIRKALEMASPGAPERAAIRISELWEPRTADEIGQSPFTRKLRLLDGDANEAGEVLIVLDAAGPSFARFVQRGGERHWLLHHNFVALVVEHATARDGSGIARRFAAPQMEILPSQAMPRPSAIKPLFAGAQQDLEFGSGNRGRSAARRPKIDLGPEVLARTMKEPLKE